MLNELSSLQSLSPKGTLAWAPTWAAMLHETAPDNSSNSWSANKYHFGQSLKLSETLLVCFITVYIGTI